VFLDGLQGLSDALEERAISDLLTSVAKKWESRQRAACVVSAWRTQRSFSLLRQALAGKGWRVEEPSHCITRDVRVGDRSNQSSHIAHDLEVGELAAPTGWAPLPCLFSRLK
jgi:hypothetical protein